MAGALTRFASALLFFLPDLALAGAAITVDGQNRDWAATQSCFPEVTGEESQKLGLDQVCLENNTSSRNAGSLFLMMESSAAWPSSLELSYGYGLDYNNNG